MISVLETRCVVNQEDREKHILHALSLGLPVCGFEPVRSRKLAIVASGPSVNDYRQELLDWDGDIWAINGAYRYLMREFGIVPHGFVGVDPQREMLQFFDDPNQATTFYLASCTHPDVFERLTGYDVRLWHSNSDTNEILPSKSVAVPGGITCVTRAPFVAYMIGYRDVTIYGADCSYEELPYAYATESKQCDPKDETITVKCNGKLFKTETGLMHQASNLGALEETFPGKLTFRCGGMLPEFLKSMRKLEDFLDSAD